MSNEKKIIDAKSRIEGLIQAENKEMIEIHSELIQVDPTSKGVELGPMRLMRYHVNIKKEWEMVYNLFENQITPTKMIRQMYQGLKGQTLSFDSLCQFIMDGNIYAQWSYVLKEPNSLATTSVTLKDESSPKRQKLEENSMDEESSSTNALECDFLSRDGDILTFTSQSYEVYRIREEWQQHIYNQKPIKLHDFTSWLKNDVIPYMKNVANMLHVLRHDHELYKFYEAALITVDMVFFLIKDFSLQHQNKDFFSFALAVPDEFFNAVLPIQFFNSLTFFEFGVEYHTLLVKKNYVEFKSKSGDLDMNLKDFIEMSTDSVDMIKGFQSPIKLQSMERSPAEIKAILGTKTKVCKHISVELAREARKAHSFVVDILKEFKRKNTQTVDELEQLVVDCDDFLNAELLGHSRGVLSARDILGVAQDDIFYSSHPVFSDLKTNRKDLFDRFSLFQPRSPAEKFPHLTLSQ